MALGKVYFLSMQLGLVDRLGVERIFLFFLLLRHTPVLSFGTVTKCFCNRIYKREEQSLQDMCIEVRKMDVVSTSAEGMKIKFFPFVYIIENERISSSQEMCIHI